MEKKILPFALKIILDNRGWIYTSELIRLLTDAYGPTGYWLSILRNRNDTHFSQIVRNLVCNRDKLTNAIHDGSLYYSPDHRLIYLKND